MSNVVELRPRCKCSVCGNDRGWPGTEKCDPCWEVTRHFEDIARTPHLRLLMVRELEATEPEIDMKKKPKSAPAKQYDLPLVDPIKVDGDVIVRHVGGSTQIATLHAIAGDEIILRFSLAGFRKASLETGRFTERARSMAGMAHWSIDRHDLDRLRVSSVQFGATFAKRVKEERYGKDD